MSASYFTLKKGQDKQFYFNLKAANHEIILQSEGYKSKAAAQKGIASVQSNGQMDDYYQVFLSNNEKHYFVLRARNGQVIGRSQMYGSLQSAQRGIVAVQSAVVDAEVREEN